MSDDIVLSHKKDGTPYVRLYLGKSPITGKTIRPYREFGGMTDEDALHAAEVWRDSLAGTYEAESQRTGAMLTRYVDYMQAQGRSYNTIKTYRLYTRRYAAPLARMLVSKVTPRMLDDLFFELQVRGPRGGRPLSPNTVKKFREYLKGAFGYFTRLGLTESNPIADTMSIAAVREDAHVLDETDMRTLRAHLVSILSEPQESKLGIMRRNAAMGMLVALHTGMRVGEVCALRRRDVNLTAGLVNVNGNVVERDGEAVRQARTKGKRTRNVSMDSALSDALRAHLAWQDGYLGSAGRDTPICTVDGSHMRPNTLSEQYARCRDVLGLDPQTTFHSLRHTHATMLLQAGTEVHTVSERLGHAQPSTTLNIYSHVLEGRDRAAAEAFGRMMG